MTIERPSTLARVMAVIHIAVVAAGIWRFVRDPSWLFALLLGGIIFFMLYWVREATGR